MTSTTHHKTLLHRMGKAIGDTARANESHFTELLGSLGHLGVLFLAFGFVVVLFMWKEGRLNPRSTNSNIGELPKIEPTMALKQVPRADVGMRMIFDQANGELSTGSGRIATPSAYPRSVENTQEDMTQEPNPPSDLPTIDIIGPWTCVYEQDGSSIQLYIQNKLVKLVSSSGGGTERTLLNGDCLYTWGGAKNTKQCGIGQYVDIFTSMAGTDGLDIGSMIASDVTDNAQAQIYENLIRTCQKTPVAQSVFTVPEGVKWDESSTEDLLNLFQ